MTRKEFEEKIKKMWDEAEQKSTRTHDESNIGIIVDFYVTTNNEKKYIKNLKLSPDRMIGYTQFYGTVFDAIYSYVIRNLSNYEINNVIRFGILNCRALRYTIEIELR